MVLPSKLTRLILLLWWERKRIKMQTAAASLPFYTPTSHVRRTHRFNPSILRNKFCNKNGYSIFTCRAAASSSITEFDLYDLLGIDSSSDQSQIKLAYRSLQKRCHPDIAGPAGHDMAIILNEAYATLSDPNSRLVYDQVCDITWVYFI